MVFANWRNQDKGMQHLHTEQVLVTLTSLRGQHLDGVGHGALSDAGVGQHGD